MKSEKQTRVELIDRHLGRAGWSIENRRLIEEFTLCSNNHLREDPAAYGNEVEFIDYVLVDQRNSPLAIVEAKRASRDALEGERQAADYADRIQEEYGNDPFIFLANGQELWFWHRKHYPPRKVSGFFTEDDLIRIAHLDRYGKQLTGVLPSAKIIDRAYQLEAVKTIAERIDDALRKFLLVLATGTGKTRVAVALVELLQRQERIQRVLFLADRRELVKQALGAFKEHLPGVPRAWIEGGIIDKEAQIHFATYPGMMAIYQRLSPGYYDLIIADESHRSVYSRYKSILDHFDSLQLGLTATPTDFLDHNTFQLFDCVNDAPTYYYSYEEAVQDKHLVPYRPVHVARTSFQIEGLSHGELPPEVRQQVEEQGINPDEFSFEGSDLEKKVTNSGTNDAVVREFMDHAIKDATGTLPAKSILFAVSHRHALELYKSFNRLYPDLQRRGLAKVIDSHMERAEKTLDEFKNKDFPRVAISVDMLDTGVDIPAIRNLVFAKPVFSKVKFWQMLGRGTRKWTDPISGQEKADFLVIDHWDNFEYFQVNRDGRETHASEPLPSRLFRLRLEKLQILAGREDNACASHTLGQLRRQLGSLPLENINVAPHSKEIRRLLDGDSSVWFPLTEELIALLCQTIAPLLRFTVSGSYGELLFETQTEQLALAHLRADSAEIDSLRGRIGENLSLLPISLPEVRPHLPMLASIAEDAYWAVLSIPGIMHLQETFAPLMRFRNRREPGTFVKLTMPDQVVHRRWVTYGLSGEGTFAEAYRAQIEAVVRDLADDHPALQRLKNGVELSDQDIEALGQALQGPDLFITEARLREAYEQPEGSLSDFLRHILAVSQLPSREGTISLAFDQWVFQHPELTATQLMFIRTLRKALLQRAEIASLDQLRVAPFTAIGDPEQLFSPPVLSELMDLVQSVAA